MNVSQDRLAPGCSLRTESRRQFQCCVSDPYRIGRGLYFHLMPRYVPKPSKKEANKPTLMLFFSFRVDSYSLKLYRSPDNLMQIGSTCRLENGS